MSARPHLLEFKLARLAVVGRHLPLVPLGVHHLIAPQLAQLRRELGLAPLVRVGVGVGVGAGCVWGVRVWVWVWGRGEAQLRSEGGPRAPRAA